MADKWQSHSSDLGLTDCKAHVPDMPIALTFYMMKAGKARRQFVKQEAPEKVILPAWVEVFSVPSFHNTEQLMLCQTLVPGQFAWQHFFFIHDMFLFSPKTFCFLFK